MYSPSGRIRSGGPSLNTYNAGQVANRVRREPAVSGSMNANSRSNSRGRAEPGSLSNTNTSLRDRSNSKTNTNTQRVYGNS